MLKYIITSLLLALLIVGSASADVNSIVEALKNGTDPDIGSANDSAWEIFDTVADEQNLGGKDTKGAYDGFAQEYREARRSPTLFNIVETKRGDSKVTLLHPELTRLSKWTPNLIKYDTEALTLAKQDGQVSYEPVELETITLHNLNLAVDDEIFKSQMMIYQSLNSMAQGLLRDEKQISTYLDNMYTVRGVTLLTLELLDGDVASSLSKAQQQADMATLQGLLKQISWHTAEIARPDRQELFRDVDEKFEACMLNGNTPENFHTDHIDKECPGECDLVYSKASDPYHYCTCCAERSTTINQSAAGTAGDKAYQKPLCEQYLEEEKITFVAGKTFSVVERAFLGMTRQPPSEEGYTSPDSNIESIVDLTKRFALNFRNIYGDICYYQEAENGPLRKKFLYPLTSVQQLIRFMRNGSDSSQPLVEPPVKVDIEEGISIFLDWSIGNDGTVAGICPAFQALLYLVRNNELEAIRVGNANQKETLERIWAIASVGGMLTVEDLVNVKELGDPPDYISVHQDRFVETYCDAAAVMAFKRLHLRMGSITEDYLMHNTKISPSERERVLKLLNGPMAQLNRALNDAKTQVEKYLVGAATETDRKEEASRGSSMAATRSLQEMAQQFGETVPFGASAPGNL